MKKLNFLSILIAGSVSIPCSVVAEEKGVYIFGSTGTARINDIDYSASLGGVTEEFDYGFSPEFGIGYDFGTFRTEASYSLINSDTSKIGGVEVSGYDTEVKTFYVSAAYDFRADKKWQPYVGVGVGKTEVETSLLVSGVKVSASVDDITTVKVKLGVNYEATDNLDIYGELYNAAIEDIKGTTGGTSYTLKDASATGISLGLRYKL